MENRTPLVDLGRAVTRGWWLILLTMIVCGAVAVGIREYVVTVKYDATAVMTVEPLTADGQVSMETEQVIVTSNSVLERALPELPRFSLQSLKQAVTVVVPRNSNALQITASADRPATAARAANAVAEAYRDNRIDSAHNADAAAIQDLTGRIGALQSKLAVLPKNSPDAASLRSELTTLQDQVTALDAHTIYPGELVSRATRPTSPSTQSLAVFVTGGLVLGLIAGFFLAVLVDRVRVEMAIAAAKQARRIRRLDQNESRKVSAPKYDQAR